MEDKRTLERYRAQQFSVPHAAITAGAIEGPAALAAGPDTSASRVVLHFDADAFCESLPVLLPCP